MRVIILTNRQGNQIALAHKLAKYVDVAAIVFSRNIPKKTPSYEKRARLLINSISGRIVGREFIGAWRGLQDKYESIYKGLPTGNIVEVDNVNDPAVVETIDMLSPDLVVVSGTNLVGQRVISTAQKSLGIVNLHTGISPYVKGGPNCTNWCLAKGWFHLIGSTVMWLDLGIDTGNIIATEQTALTGNESLSELHWKVMEHAHDVYVKAIVRILEGSPVPSIPQKSIGDGNHFNSVDWNAFEMRKASYNFRHKYKNYFSKQNGLNNAGDLVLFPIRNV